MALKGKNLASSSSLNDDWKGPWGEIRSSEVRFIHFVRDAHGIEEVWTYPYETLVRWVFKKSAPQQELQILAGGDLITIRGYGLEKLLAPLQEKCLARVAQQMVRFAALEPNGCCVVEIKIEPSR